MAITDKQLAFVNYYLGISRFNGTDAARRAGYSLPNKQAIQIRQHPDVIALINQRLAEQTLMSNEVLGLLSEHAKGTLRHFVSQRGEEIVVNLTTEQAQENFHLLKKVKIKKRSGGSHEQSFEEVETEIELHDVQSALIQLGRHHKLFIDKIEQSGTLDVSLLGALTEAEIDARLLEQKLNGS